MGQSKTDKTNVMRLLDAAGISYKPHFYDETLTDGNLIAKTLGEFEEQVFKSLICVSNQGDHFVFCIPVNHELDLKKAAKAAGRKSMEMIKQKELLPLTGYIHGGCSPMGLKKPFPVYVEETMELFDTIFISAGRVGDQVEMNPTDLRDVTKCRYAHLVKD